MSNSPSKIMPRSITEERYKYLCELLREAVNTKTQDDQKISKKELAEIIGITPSELTKILQGGRRMDPVFYYDFCEAVGIDFAKLLRQVSLDSKRVGKKPRQ